MPTTGAGVAAWLGSSGVAAAAATAVVGAIASSALTKKPAEQPQQPLSANANAKPPTAQEATSPEDIAKKNALAASATGALSGNSATVLTGANGISPANLNLGRSSLLGQ